MNLYPSKQVLRKMGLSADQQGILRRYVNESKGWESHLEATKNFIKQSILKEKPKSVAILGSGWLLDVPIEFLIENCEQVYLCDVRHPKQIVRRLKKYEQVHFITIDLTGGAIEYVYRAIKNNEVEKQLPEFVAANLKPHLKAEYIVSVNLLNQLDILIVESLRNLKKFNKDLISGFRKKIQQAHIDFLLTDKSCLITDYEEQLFDRTDTFVENHSLLYVDLPMSGNEQEWIWKFDSRMNYYRNRKTYFKVIAKQF